MENMIKHVFTRSRYKEPYLIKAEEFFSALFSAMEENGIDTTLRKAHFLAQVSHESDNFQTTEEYASGQAYEGRKDLGNTQKGDGARYKGRGLIQVTGRHNYKKYAAYLTSKGWTAPLLEHPELVASDVYFTIMSAIWYWNKRGLNKWADKDDIRQITRRINGGYNGIKDRTEKYEKYIKILKQ